MKEAYVNTVDGWSLAVRHYEPRERSQPHPVVLCHGFAASGRSFELGQTTMVNFLVERGYDVFVGDLRGHGTSTHNRGVRDWAFSEYVEIDAPLLVSHACEVTGSKRAHWIGHSMGGIIGLGLTIDEPEVKLASLTTVGSSLDYSASGSDWSLFHPLFPLIKRLPSVPVGGLARLESRLLPTLRTPFSTLNVWPGNSDHELWQNVCREVFSDTSTGVIAQLTSGLEPGGLRSARDPSRRYMDAAKVIKVPTMIVTGDRDKQCPPLAARRTFDAVGTPDKELVVFGRGRGDRYHYGHFDLVIGKHATTEVFPALERWMSTHPSPGERALS